MVGLTIRHKQKGEITKTRLYFFVCARIYVRRQENYSQKIFIDS